MAHDGIDFCELITSLTHEEKKNLAEEFEVAISTVERWGTGVANPHPRIRSQIIKLVMG